MVFLQHLHVWVIREAIFANGWEVRTLPTGAVQILLDLRGRHGRYLAWCFCIERGQDQILESVLVIDRVWCGGAGEAGVLI